MADCIALVVAAGRGLRVGGEIPKQYRSIDGRPVLRRTLDRLSAHARIDALRVVIHTDDRALYDHATLGLSLLPPVSGGETRQESVRLGLESLREENPSKVLIHDAARPFTNTETIDRVIEGLDHAPGCIAAVPVADTLKRIKDGVVGETVERAGLWHAQTPQGFNFQAILAAHRATAGDSLTDDAAVAEKAGLTVRLVAGSEDNFKITSAADLARAERLAGGAPSLTRVGSGFDVHAFGPGDHVMLCGLRVDHGRGLAGHSDGDVAIHALVDALLGTIAAGDIGTHFPPGDPQWRDADSAMFLEHAGDLVRKAGGEIGHVDLTLICEAPKIGPHRNRMVARLAEILRIDAAKVSVKATTTERLGFTGRGEGIAAQATATVWMPR